MEVWDKITSNGKVEIFDKYINIKKYFNNKLLEHIRLRNEAEILSIIGEAKLYQLNDSAGTTLLHFAAVYGNSKFSQFLIDLGANVDAQNHMKETPLMFAVDSNVFETVWVLLKAAADIFLPDVTGQCALGKALNNRMKINKKIMTALLNNVRVESLKSSKYVGSDAFQQNCPLYDFMSLNDVEVTRVLLEKGSPVDAKCPITEATALDRAIAELNVDNVKLLLEWSADVNPTRRNGLTPLAGIWNFDDQTKVRNIVELLISAGALLIDHFHLVIQAASVLRYGNREVIQAILRAPINLYFRDRRNMTPVHFLVINKNPGVVEELRNFNANTLDRIKGQMLHYAVQRYDISLIKLLLERGTNVNALRYHCTALCFLVDRLLADWNDWDEAERDLQTLRHRKCIDVLLNYGADPQIITEDNFDHVYLSFYSPYPKKIINTLRPIFARLALHAIQFQNGAIDDSMQEELEFCPQLVAILELNKEHLQSMREINIDESVTVFDFFIANDNQILQYARNNTLISNLLNAMDNFSYNSYSCRQLRKRFRKLNRLIKWKNRLISVIKRGIRKLYRVSVHNVAEKIVDYLLADKWKEIDVDNVM